MGEWQFMDPASRSNLVAAWNREAEQMLEMASSRTSGSGNSEHHVGSA